MKFLGSIEQYLHLQKIDSSTCHILEEKIPGSLTILWFKSNNNIIDVDNKQCEFNTNEIIFLTEFHKIKPKHINQIRFLRFNRPFYCILDHDSDVSCKGMLFFGASQLPLIQIPKKEISKFETLWQMFCIEMQSNDSLQIEMLQMMLKRYLILCARIYKIQEKYPDTKTESDLIREFNFLVEQYFKTKHTVKEYAELLSKSPKTLSNLFLKIGFKSPLQYIHDRKVLESKKLLRYSSLHIKEVGFEIGFEDLQSFSRFFKKHTGMSPSQFKHSIN